MRMAIWKLGLCLLTLGVLACEWSEPEAPCRAAEAALGLCRLAGDPGPPVVPPDWAVRLCEDWHSRDGSCRMRAIAVDFEECRRTQGFPALEGLRENGVGNRASLRQMERLTNLCLEQRRWIMTEAARARWHRRAAPPKSPS